MRPEAQRIAIAEACGWRWFKLDPHAYQARHYRCLLHPDLIGYTPHPPEATMAEPICARDFLWKHGSVPDYVFDLNAMHDAEAWLLANFIPSGNWNTASWWENNLMVVCNGGVPLTAGYYSHRACHATAAQRAEAFLRTIGKWEESA